MPSFVEWASTRVLTSKKDWNEPQRKMMKRAGRVHGLRILGTLVFVLLVSWAVRDGYCSLRASSLVEALQKVATPDVPAIVNQLSYYRRWADPRLVRVAQGNNPQTREHLHASLALLPVNISQVDYLFDRLIKATPTELAVLRDALKPHKTTLIPKLWTVLESAKPGDATVLPCASAVAIYDPDNTKWESLGGKVAQALVSVNSVFVGSWLEALRPVQGRLTIPLAEIFRDKKRTDSERTRATNIIADYASDDLRLIADLLMDAGPKAYAALFPIALRHAADTWPFFGAEIGKKVNSGEIGRDLEQARDRLAERQARAAVALVRIGKAEEVWPLLRHSPDPRLRSFIINWLNPLGADSRPIGVELERIDPNAKPTPAPGQQKMDAILFHPQTSMRRALILALGTYGTDVFSPGERELLIAKLLELYRNDPDSGIHGAVEWTLRQWGQEEKLRSLDTELLKLKERCDRRWFVNSQGQTFAVIEGPVHFLMGSPPTERDRFAEYEIPHHRIIPRRFAIDSHEVSIEQYEAFRKENSRSSDLSTDRYSPDPKGPRNNISWYDAAAYSNWLSRKEGLRSATSGTGMASMRMV